MSAHMDDILNKSNSSSIPTKKQRTETIAKTLAACALFFLSFYLPWKAIMAVMLGLGYFMSIKMAMFSGGICASIFYMANKNVFETSKMSGKWTAELVGGALFVATFLLLFLGAVGRSEINRLSFMANGTVYFNSAATNDTYQFFMSKNMCKDLAADYLKEIGNENTLIVNNIDDGAQLQNSCKFIVNKIEIRRGVEGHS